MEEKPQQRNARNCFKCQKRNSSNLDLCILAFHQPGGPEATYSSIDEKMDVQRNKIITIVAQLIREKSEYFQRSEIF